SRAVMNDEKHVGDERDDHVGEERWWRRRGWSRAQMKVVGDKRSG
ncbi:hypothetical protein A2U01_0066075, partial [Trifolium medium]|nr:hypothetical protein [Trifolium medium]